MRLNFSIFSARESLEVLGFLDFEALVAVFSAFEAAALEEEDFDDAGRFFESFGWTCGEDEFLFLFGVVLEDFNGVDGSDLDLFVGVRGSLKSGSFDL